MNQPKRVLCVALTTLTSLVTLSAVNAQEAIPTVDVREEMRIASNDTAPGMLLTGIEDLAVLPDGRIVTAHYREAVVRVFDPNGRLLTVIGRRGQGPGEFRNAWQVGYIGERIWVNTVGGHYQLFDARTYELVGTVARGPNSGSFRGLTSDSTSLHTTGMDDSTRVTIYDRRGQRRTSIDLSLRRAGHQFPMQMQEIAPGGLTGRIVARTVSSPLAAYTALTLAPGGREIIVLEPSEIWNGPPGQFTIRRIPTTTLRVSAPVTVSLPVHRVTPAEADSIVAELNPLIKGRLRREPKLAAEYREKAKVPATFPAFSYFTPSADGVLWLAEHGRPDTRLIIDPTGKPLMRVRLPQGFRVAAVTRTHVWGITYDADDLPIISRYRVVGS